MSFQILAKKSAQFAFTAVIAAVLVGCGGGSGGSTPAQSAAPTPAPTPVAANLVTSVPAANYTGEPAAAFNLLNAERLRCGFGLLTQNAALDAAAMAHANYSKVNGIVSHTEVQGLPGFTGVTPQDRAKGYVGTVGEVMAAESGERGIRTLLSAPYHLRAMVDSYRDVGFAVLETGVVGYAYFVGELGFQTTSGPQLAGSSEIQTYPCNGTSGVNFQLRGESPNPVPGRNLSSQPIGTPVMFRVRDGQTIAITSVSMVKTTNNAAVALRPVITALNDPNNVNGVSYFRMNEAYVAPDAPLERLTQYTVTFSGTNNGVAIASRSFTFTTGNGVN